MAPLRYVTAACNDVRRCRSTAFSLDTSRHDSCREAHVVTRKRRVLIATCSSNTLHIRSRYVLYGFRGARCIEVALPRARDCERGVFFGYDMAAECSSDFDQHIKCLVTTQRLSWVLYAAHVRDKDQSKVYSLSAGVGAGTMSLEKWCWFESIDLTDRWKSAL